MRSYAGESLFRGCCEGLRTAAAYAGLRSINSTSPQLAQRYISICGNAPNSGTLRASIIGREQAKQCADGLSSLANG
jgi:hypothetical protein